MADFKEAFELTLAHEGGYVKDPDDRGGETYKGIARRYNPGWSGWARIDKAKKQALKVAGPDKANPATEGDDTAKLRPHWHRGRCSQEEQDGAEEQR